MNTLGCQLSEEARLSGQEWRGTEAESIPPQQSSRVIHGRKASTFLGIFDSAPPLDSKGSKKQSQVQLQLYSGATEDKSGVSEDQSKKKRKKKKREKELAQLVEDEDNTDGKAIMTSLGSRQQDLELYGGGVSDVSVSQESVLKPISSATYFPHKLKEGQDNDSVGQVEPQHKHDNIHIARRHSSSEVSIASRGESSVLSCSTETAIVDSEDEDNVFSSDETQEFPLKVELQPFTDNVGGHTAIFRFSERAVCKTLVNRENNWYETIELKHPDLLQFMPRYIGVLNVRQHFNSKEDFLNSLSPKKAKVIHEEYRDNIQAAIDGLPSSELQPLLNASSPINMDETPLPEVCLDDNKHIIPDSLWCRYSHSPSSLPSEHSWPGTSDRSNNEISNLCGANPSSAAPIHPTGSTLVNTRLKDLIIEEVFGQPSVPSRSQQIISHHHQSHGRNHSRHVVQHTRHHSNPNDRSEKMRIQYSDSIAAFPNTKQSRSSSTSSTTNRFASRKVRHDSRNSLVDLREMKQDICSKGDDELFGLDDDSSVVVSVPSSPKSQPQATAHESISYEEVSHTVVSKFILLEDLTRKLKNPCVLDLKMGTRQYGVDAKRSKQLSQREKCRNTTSRRLGVRICGLKIWNRDYYIIRDKYFGRRVKIGWQFVRVLARFLYDGISKKSILRQIPSLIRQLDTLYSEVVKLKSYRMYGASLLLMYDGSNPSDKRGQVKLNLIDFARCVTKKDMETSISTFRVPPKNPESEDRGFLRGLRSLRFYLLVIWNYLTGGHPLVYDEGELMEYLNSEEEFQNGWDWIGEFEKENESGFNDSSDELRKKWRKYELIFGVEPRCGDEDVSD